ncbi:MAG: hypothetical protein ACJ76V_17265 [Thermoleophilaceae bacterium]
MSLWERVAGLPIEVDSYALEALERDVSSDFTRLSTVVHLSGGGEEGLGEDVTYDGVDHIALQDAGPLHDLSGSSTFADYCERVGSLDLFPADPVREVSRLYRRWAFESAGLDLALRQAGRSLAEVVGRDPQPVTFVVSLRLGDPPTMEPLRRRLDLYPDLRFKLDPVQGWDDGLIADLVATGAVDSVDLKGFYKGTVVDNPGEPGLYRRVLEAFPDAWVEDPDVNDDTRSLLEPVRDRITWDAPIHSVADVEELEWTPRLVNIKPSRFGSVQELFHAYDYCDANGIGAYGGGQFELGVGRGHIQYLASLFHPDTPNDTAPSGYNAVTPEPGLPSSPLPPAVAPKGFRWEAPVA